MDATEAKKAKDRSPTFPFITLEKALERVRQFYAEERRGVAPYARAVLHWKYSEASSGGLQTVSALKSYGLMKELGGTGTSRQLQLSELALRIHLDQRPDSLERLTYIREAATTPAVAAELYVKWPDDLPSDSTLNHYLVLEKKFNEATALTAIKILKENHQFAQLDSAAVLSVGRKIEEDEVIEDASRIQGIPPGDVAVAAGMQRKPLLLSNPYAAVSVPTPARSHTEQHLHLDGTTVITLNFSDTPTSAVYEYLSAVTKFKAEQLKAQEKAMGSQTPGGQAA